MWVPDGEATEQQCSFATVDYWGVILSPGTMQAIADTEEDVKNSFIDELSAWGPGAVVASELELEQGEKPLQPVLKKAAQEGIQREQWRV